MDNEPQHCMTARHIQVSNPSNAHFTGSPMRVGFVAMKTWRFIFGAVLAIALMSAALTVHAQFGMGGMGGIGGGGMGNQMGGMGGMGGGFGNSMGGMGG